MYVKLKHASEHRIIITVVNLICLSVIWFNHDKILVYHYLGAFPVLGRSEKWGARQTRTQSLLLSALWFMGRSPSHIPMRKGINKWRLGPSLGARAVGRGCYNRKTMI